MNRTIERYVPIFRPYIFGQSNQIASRVKSINKALRYGRSEELVKHSSDNMKRQQNQRFGHLSFARFRKLVKIDQNASKTVKASM